MLCMAAFKHTSRNPYYALEAFYLMPDEKLTEEIVLEAIHAYPNLVV
eukprot:COSAG02_NODE_19983_length_854_cov_0.945695_3_plen_46_part_01